MSNQECARMRAKVEAQLEAGAFWPEPLLQLNPTFQPGGTIDDLVADGTLHPECAKIFRLDKTQSDLTGKQLLLHAHQTDGIVNAIAHRDYASDAAVQVSVFADRFEVWNPGQLPPPLTPEKLRHPHSSIARNHCVCETLFLARYIEKFGTGTLMMIRESLAHALPEPDFVQQAGEFVTTVWRDWLTEKVIAELGLNERQKQAMNMARTERQLTNARSQQITGAGRSSSMSDGTLRAFGILLALFQNTAQEPGAPLLIGLEEPEMALHPAATSVLLSALREASLRTQILVTSHSPDLLDDENIATELLLAVDSLEGVTRIAPLDEAGRSVLHDRLFTAGELLRQNQLAPDAAALAEVETGRQLQLFELGRP